MKMKNKSIFNLIEIFSQRRKQIMKKISRKAHCDQRSHHDFYCDTEKPFIQLEK